MKKSARLLNRDCKQHKSDTGTVQHGISHGVQRTEGFTILLEEFSAATPTRSENSANLPGLALETISFPLLNATAQDRQHESHDRMTTPCQSKYFSCELTRHCPSDGVDKFINVLVDLNLHQVDAALIAFRPPLKKGIDSGRRSQPWKNHDVLPTLIARRAMFSPQNASGAIL